ncbi:MAG: hypothetical protein EVA89_00470 [Sandaracinaceae bacterium]|nr:MAG: hypothetical protein EVA89_00470 [Sandaracinaceae bacterium]
MFEALDQAEDDFLTVHGFVAFAGRSMHDGWALTRRFDPEVGDAAHECESWVVRYVPEPTGILGTRVELRHGGATFLSGLWMDAGGDAWIGSPEGVVVVPLVGASVRRHALPAPIVGVHGVAEELVFAWSEPGARVFRYDGADWNEVECPGQPLRMAGTSPDALFAVGYDGFIAWWNGSRFVPIGNAGTATVSGIAVAPDSRAWATTLSGELYEVSPNGTRLRARHDGPILDVAVFAGEPVLAGGDLGLLGPQPNSLDLPPITEPFFAEAFGRPVPSDRLIVVCGSGVAETADMVSFDVLPDLHLYEARNANPPLWR